jgi:hypothetical protein
MWYMSNMAVLRRAQDQLLAMVYWPYTTPPRALMLKCAIFKMLECLGMVFMASWRH